MAHIEYFFSPLSPFTYLAGDRLERIAGRHNADITYKPFDLTTVFGRTGGTPLPERHEARKAYRLQDLTRIARHNDMALNLKPAFWPTNPAPAAYAIIAAQNAADGDLAALVQGILRACFADEQDIADDAVLQSCLQAAGFAPSLVTSAMMTSAETYAANTEQAVARGVFGSPFYIVGEERFWGQDRLAYLDEFLA